MPNCIVWLAVYLFCRSQGSLRGDSPLSVCSEEGPFQPSSSFGLRHPFPIQSAHSVGPQLLPIQYLTCFDREKHYFRYCSSENRKFGLLK